MPILSNPKHEAARYYVYTLTDPRDGKVFYIGKGCGERDKSHTRDARHYCTKNPAKTRRILDIEAGGKSVVVERIATGLTEGQAFRRERSEIAAVGLANLTNITPGQNTEPERLLLEIDHGLSQLYGYLSAVLHGQPTTKEQWHMNFEFIRSLRKMRADALAEIAV